MACGCPVLAAKNSSLFEIGGDAALYAEKQCPKLYAKKLSDIKDCKNILVSKGLERAKMFTWEKTFNKTLSIYIKGLKRKLVT
ncbi:glycosyl transferase, partial [Gammaproteobacteria bacterium]|nr:glycosyl transferase [Gammaproteobacteria bacterium]